MDYPHSFLFYTVFTSAWPRMSSAHVFHCGHLSLSANVVSLEPQQHCSWLNHSALRHTPSFRSFIQSAAMSIKPAKAPETGDGQQRGKDEDRETVCVGAVSQTRTINDSLLRETICEAGVAMLV